MEVSKRVPNDQISVSSAFRHLWQRGFMTTKHSTCMFCDGGDGLMVERRDDGLFIYAVPPFLRYVSQNLIFAILTRIFEVFQDAANDADACFPSSTKTWFSVWRPKNCKISFL